LKVNIRFQCLDDRPPFGQQPFPLRKPGFSHFWPTKAFVKASGVSYKRRFATGEGCRYPPICPTPPQSRSSGRQRNRPRRKRMGVKQGEPGEANPVGHHGSGEQPAAGVLKSNSDRSQADSDPFCHGFERPVLAPFPVAQGFNVHAEFSGASPDGQLQFEALLSDSWPYCLSGVVSRSCMPALARTKCQAIEQPSGR
jgi:hypothetical protein